MSYSLVFSIKKTAPNIGSSAIGIYPLYFCIVKQDKNHNNYQDMKEEKSTKSAVIDGNTGIDKYEQNSAQWKVSFLMSLNTRNSIPPRCL